MNELTSIDRATAYETGFTVEAFLRLCDAGAFDREDGKIELVRGLIDYMPPPLPDHSRYSFLIASLLATTFDSAAFWVGVEVGIPTGPKSYRTADVAVVRSSVPGARRLENPGADVPLVVEVLHSSRTRDLVDKVADYADAGIANYLVVDVETRVTHAFRLEGGSYMPAGDPVPFGQALRVPGTDRMIILPE